MCWGTGLFPITPYPPKCRARETAESARLAIADVMAEARERVGEEVPPPAVADADHDHDHDH